MRKTKNSSSFALISYVSRCYHDSDWESLKNIGVSREQAGCISRLSAFESNILSTFVARSKVFELHFSDLKNCYRFVSRDPISLSGAASRIKEVDLCLHIFNHVITLYRTNKIEELRQFGMKPVQAEFISQLPWLELQKLARYFWFFATVGFDAGRMGQALKTTIASSRWMEQCFELIRADAPRDLMMRYYGMSCDLYAEAREMHGRQSRGRPRAISDDLQHKLYQAFLAQSQSHVGISDPMRQPGFLLELYESLDRKVSLREIWRLVQEWMGDQSNFPQQEEDSVEWPDPDQVEEEVPSTAPRRRKRESISPPPDSTSEQSAKPSSSEIDSRCDRAGTEG